MHDRRQTDAVEIIFNHLFTITTGHLCRIKVELRRPMLFLLVTLVVC